jgi:hypothetical protein
LTENWIGFTENTIQLIVNTVLNILENSSTENNLNIELFNIAMTFITDTIVFSDLSDMNKKIICRNIICIKLF